MLLFSPISALFTIANISIDILVSLINTDIKFAKMVRDEDDEREGRGEPGGAGETHGEDDGEQEEGSD